MSASPATTVFKCALIGNPNTGKTTIFNALTGFKARVGNYAGVTVEHKTGPLRGHEGRIDIVDLPGTYSLAARSADEMVAVDVLLGNHPEEPRPDLVIVVADASNLERNLFLATQVFELGLPVILVLNMLDVARDQGIEVNAEDLSRRLGVPVVACIAAKEQGVGEIARLLTETPPPACEPPAVFPPEVPETVERLREALLAAGVSGRDAHPFLVRRTLLELDGMAEKRLLAAGGESAARALSEARASLAAKGHKLATLEARLRYGWIRRTLIGVLRRPERPPRTSSDRIDAFLIHRFWGTVIFSILMVVVFQAIYSWSAPLMDAIDSLFALAGEWVTASVAEGPLRSFLAEGVIAGVGGVVIFLPQIVVLFFFISLLEDCGYMARAAFLMDRLLSRCGLSGRSFIPMLSSFACAIPGIMGARVIEDPRDRLTTILIAPLMSCSARLPVYMLLISTFVPERDVIPGLLGLQAFALFCMYVVGIVVAIPVALILKKTLLKGKAPAFVMELPSYKMPSWKMVLHRMYERGVSFLKRAGTTIFAVSVVIWALTYYPRPEGIAAGIEAEYAGRMESVADAAESQALTEERDAAIAGAYLRQSVLGRLGHVIEPAVVPLGWDWKIGMAVLASFPAREVVVATLGIIYDVGAEADEESDSLKSKLRSARTDSGDPVFTMPVALSIMVFFALCLQCASTIVVMRRETNSWRWPLFAFAYMTGLAYVGALITYQIARLLIA